MVTWPHTVPMRMTRFGSISCSQSLRTKLDARPALVLSPHAFNVANRALHRLPNYTA